MKAADDSIDSDFDDVYELYAKHLEADHWGEFVAVARDGRYEIGTDMGEVVHRAVGLLGPGLYLYKIGPRAVGKIR